MIQYSREIEVRYQADIFIAGGGPSGCATAWAAALAGKKVILAEACGALGGMGTMGRVPAFCMFTDGKNFLAGGFGRLIHDTCIQRGAVSPDTNEYRALNREGISIVSEKLKTIYDDIVVGCGTEVHFFTKVIDVIEKGSHIEYVVCSGQSSIFAIEAEVYIDCTGDGVLAYYAGARFAYGDSKGNVQAGTLCSLWSDIDWDKAREKGYHGKSPRNGKMLQKAYEDGVISVCDPHLPGMWRVGQTVGGGNIGHIFSIDGTDEMSLTEGMLAGRAMLKEYEEYYRRYLEGFENAVPIDSGALMGIRETRRIVGDYVLTYEDFLRKAFFEDEIGRYNYEIDAHASSIGSNDADEHKELIRCGLEEGESYGIPYRCLTPKGFDNLLVAGRCISCDHYMQASVRAMPGCFITGQAAGQAAAMAVEDHAAVNCLDTEILRKRLREIGAYLPE